MGIFSISPIDGRYEDKVDPHLRELWSEFGLIKSRVFIEVKWFIHLCEDTNINSPTLSDTQERFLESLHEDFDEDDALEVKEIEKGTNHDVKAVELYISHRMQDSGLFTDNPELWVHFSCTSEDINNLAYAVRLRSTRDTLVGRLLNLRQTIRNMAHQYAQVPMISRTHGQPATPTTVGKELANYCHRLNRQILQLEDLKFLGKMNGASGNYNAQVVAIGGDTPEGVKFQNARFIEKVLFLYNNPYTTQIEPHDNMVEMFHVMMRINTILIDMCRDMWGYISLGYFTQKVVAGEVGSSTMPHKVNPINFENAEGNLGVANALLGHFSDKLPISRFQRDLSDSTVLRNVGVALAHSWISYEAIKKGLSTLEVDTGKVMGDLTPAWELMAEPLQTIMRREGIPDAYNQLKELTRGQKVTRKLILQFIEQLELAPEVKQELINLTPETYLGLAVFLADRI